MSYLLQKYTYQYQGYHDAECQHPDTDDNLPGMATCTECPECHGVADGQVAVHTQCHDGEDAGCHSNTCGVNYLFSVPCIIGNSIHQQFLIFSMSPCVHNHYKHDKHHVRSTELWIFNLSLKCLPLQPLFTNLLQCVFVEQHMLQTNLLNLYIYNHFLQMLQCVFVEQHMLQTNHPFELLHLQLLFTNFLQCVFVEQHMLQTNQPFELLHLQLVFTNFLQCLFVEQHMLQMSQIPTLHVCSYLAHEVPVHPDLVHTLSYRHRYTHNRN